MKQIQYCSGVVVISVQRERSQRMDVLTTLLMGLMAFHGEIPQPEVDEACEEREASLGRALEGWEREIVKAFLTNERLKATTPEERTSITNFETVTSSSVFLLFPWHHRHHLVEFVSPPRSLNHFSHLKTVL